jgi:hypothetical protein
VRRLAACALLPLALVACREHTVAVSFRPEVGATYSYEVRVRAESTTSIEGLEPEEKVEEVRLVAEHTVLDSGDDGVRVRVLVGEPGTTAQSFVVRFDRSAQLESIEAVEGGTDELVSILGVAEIFPGAAGVLPGRRLAPGERWSVEREVAVPGTEVPSEVRTTGRLVELGLDGDEEVARLSSRTVLPLSQLAPTASGLLILDGRQEIAQRATYDLDDGAVRSARATTTGHFDIQVRPPEGTVAPPVPGTLDVRVTSRTRRLG